VSGAGAHVDEVARLALDAFEKRGHTQVGREELGDLQAVVAEMLRTAVRCGNLPPYRTMGGVRDVEATSDVEVVYRGDVVRLGLVFYTDAGAREKRYYRREFRGAA